MLCTGEPCGMTPSSTATPDGGEERAADDPEERHALATRPDRYMS